MICAPTGSTSIRVEAADQAGEARRKAVALAGHFGFDETASGRLAIVVTECANNLWKHGGGGEIVISSCGTPEPCIEVLALDSGPGMADVARCFQDGYSTAGSSGTGLGAVKRLSDACEVYTAAGKGVALLARIRKRGAKAASCNFEVGGISVPKQGETACGDGFCVAVEERGVAVMVVDGLGHGPIAADCADAAVAAFQERPHEAPADALRVIHGALRATRGAAVAVARMGFRHREVQFAGVGNIAGFLWELGKAKHFVSFPGIVGHEMRTVRELTYAASGPVLALFYSDGIASHWSLDDYQGLPSLDPSLIAGVIYRDQSRRRDDATVIVAREKAR